MSFSARGVAGGSGSPPYLGELRIAAYSTVPAGWLECDGRMLSKTAYASLFGAIGYTFGGNNVDSFRIPDLRGRVAIGRGWGPGLSNYDLGTSGGAESVALTTAELPVHRHTLAAGGFGTSASVAGNYLGESRTGVPAYATTSNAAMATDAIGSTGSGAAHENRQPYIALKYMIAYSGIDPTVEVDGNMGEIRLLCSPNIPDGFLECNGGLLSVDTYAVLFNLLGTYYGGNGTTNFALPDLRGRVPVCAKTIFYQGEEGGEETHILTNAQMPAHTHALAVNSGAGTTSSPSGAYPAQNAAGDLAVTAASSGNFNSITVGTVGSGMGHENRQPYAVIRYVIGLYGIYPSH